MDVGRSLAVAVLAVLASAASVTAADPPIAATEAKDYVGKRVTVCGNVVAVGHAQTKGQGGKQTFLHFDQLPPDCPFMAVIIGNDLAGGGFFFGIDKKVQGKRTCVTGYVKRQGAIPMMILDAPNQLKVMDEGQP